VKPEIKLQITPAGRFRVTMHEYARSYGLIAEGNDLAEVLREAAQRLGRSIELELDFTELERRDDRRW
jgi:hypothetical protein